MRKVIAFVAFLVLFCSLTESFRMASIVDYAKEGYKSIKSRFGEKFWHKNITDGEEVIFDEHDEIPHPESYKASLDTILDLTKNPERQK